MGDQFAVYEVLPFSKSQQERFAQRWLSVGVEKFLIELERMKTGELQGTPLLLTIAAAVYSSDDCLPKRRSSLYERFISIWLEEAKKRGLTEDLGERLSKMVRLGLEYLANMATKYPEEDSVEKFTSWARVFLQKSLVFSFAEAEANSQNFLEVISRRSGVFIRRGDLCEWLHPTFREYLTASFMVRKYQNPLTHFGNILLLIGRMLPLNRLFYLL